MIESKREKVIEIFKQCQEIFDILETAKRDPLMANQALDPQTMVNALMEDRHFNNSK